MRRRPTPSNLAPAARANSKIQGPLDPALVERLEDKFREMLELKSRHLDRHQPGRAQLNQWLDNFTGKVFPKPNERLIALYLLTCFVDINEHEVRYLCRLLLRKFVSEELERLGKQDSDDLDGAIRTILSQTRFYPIGPPGKSGAHILYLFRLENELPDDLFLNPLDTKGPMPRVCFVDDALLTGDQAEQYRDDAERIQCKERVLLTLVATDQAIDKMKRKGFRVICAINLTQEEFGFGPHTPQLCNLKEDFEELCTKDDLIEFCKQYGDEAAPPDHGFGHGDCALLLGFDHNVPDNTLPIFWAPSPWNPIKRRRQPAEEFNDARTFV